MKAIELRDLLSYRFLSALRYAPDGRKAAFVVSNADEESNSYEARLWLYENGALRQLTDLGKERQFVWLDENRLLFPAVRSARETKRAEAGEVFSSWYVLDLRGGEALPCFTVNAPVESLRVLDESHFALSLSLDKAQPELYAADEETRAAALKRRQEDKDYEVFDELPFRFNGQGVVNGSRTGLFLYSLETRELRPLTALPDTLEAVTVCGEELVYAVSERKARQALKGFELRAANWKI